MLACCNWVYHNRRTLLMILWKLVKTYNHNSCIEYFTKAENTLSSPRKIVFKVKNKTHAKCKLTLSLEFIA